MNINDLNSDSFEERNLNGDEILENIANSEQEKLDENNNDEPDTENYQPSETEPLADYSTMSREELIEKFKFYLENYSMPAAKGNLETIKETFEKATFEEEEKLHHQMLSSYETDDEQLLTDDPLQKSFSLLLHEYKQKKDVERITIEEEKEKNLSAKYDVIEKIKDLVNRQESLNETFQAFRELQHRWREIGPVPQAKMHDLWETYHLHVENFYNYIKINNELRDLDLKKNYEAKLLLCEKAEKLILEPSVITAAKLLQKYHNQWREIGPVPRDKKDIWERFKLSTVAINQRQQEYFDSMKEQYKKNLEVKIELCKKIEALVQDEFINAKKWDAKSKQFIELQQIWKTIGFAPRRENSKIYNRYRKACDNFYSKKKEFFRQNKETQENNLQLKTELCIQAETMKDSTEWKKTTDEFIRLQKKWKEIGQVPKKNITSIWKRFNDSCEYFFTKKANYFSNIDLEQDENLKKKHDIIKEVKNYSLGPDNEKTFNDLQEFQRRWADVGFVPIREKERLAIEFRALINKHFDKISLDEGDKNLQKFRSKLENWKSAKVFNEKINQERIRLTFKLRQLESDIVIWENNIGFFTKSKNSEALVREFNSKIENGKQNIKLMNEKLKLIDAMW
ncbi:MAG: DUF349 domain-containing protein [Marinilabiliaceae bacterium]|nr:DUF349 domain-containing protein [Marinilabiliaceae bacterium]